MNGRARIVGCALSHLFRGYRLQRFQLFKSNETSLTQREVLVVDAVRTAIGSFGGSLKDVPLSDLATAVMSAALKRTGLPADKVEHVVMGNVIPTEPGDAYLSGVAAVRAGIPHETPAFNVNRLCGSGLQAIISAAQTIALGDAQVAIGAGAESMSRGPYLSRSQRWGARLVIPRCLTSCSVSCMTRSKRSIWE